MSGITWMNIRFCLMPTMDSVRDNPKRETQLLLLAHDLKHYNCQHQVDVGIPDFSKVFDTMAHKHLISKLCIYGINKIILHWIQAFFYECQQLVLCDGVKLQYSPITSEASQGTVLGPLLFLLDINNLPSMVDPDMLVHLFVDDALLYRVINTIQDQVILQQDWPGYDVKLIQLLCNTHSQWELHQVLFLPDMLDS